jgi:ribosomal protein L4
MQPFCLLFHAASLQNHRSNTFSFPQDFIKSQALHNWDRPLIITATPPSQQLQRAFANIAHVKALPVIGMNVYDVLKHRSLVIHSDALPLIHARLTPKKINVRH